MNRILLSLLATVALSCPMSASQAETAGTPVETKAPEAAPMAAAAPTEHHEGHEKVHHRGHQGMPAADMVKELEDHMSKIKESGASLTGEAKAEFDYNLEITDVEIKALKDPLHDHDRKKHYGSGQRHLKAAEHMVH